MDNVECPYCGEEQGIDECHDENDVYEQKCDNCGKAFIFTVRISYSFHATRAPCKNGEEHKLNPSAIEPSCFGIGVFSCEYCGEEFSKEPEKRQKAIETYLAEGEK